MADDKKPEAVESNAAEQHSFPGLTPVSKRLSTILSEVASLEAADYELKRIRKTLMDRLAMASSDAWTHDLLLMALGNDE